VTRYHFDPDGILRTPDGRVAGECYPMPGAGDEGDRVAVEIGPPVKAVAGQRWRETVPHGLYMPEGVGDVPGNYSASKSGDWDNDDCDDT